MLKENDCPEIGEAGNTGGRRIGDACFLDFSVQAAEKVPTGSHFIGEVRFEMEQ